MTAKKELLILCYKATILLSIWGVKCAVDFEPLSSLSALRIISRKENDRYLQFNSIALNSAGKTA